MILLGKTADGETVSIRVEVRHEKTVAPHRTVEHEPCAEIDEVSITHEIRDPRLRGDKAVVSCGAGAGKAIREVVDPADGWTSESLEELAKLAERWHLNAMRAGCAHQEVVWETAPGGWRQPSLTLTKPCPETGYRYGSAWLVEPLPPEVLARFRELDR